MNNLRDNLDYLKHIEAFQFVVSHLQGKYNDTIVELTECSRDDQPKMVGKLAAYREILDVLEP